ncbi:hypothetical protein A4H97_21520 [Niastella yeongjuensis]|uniref:FecR protein domain-containing protein n=1 Tax=Niastella yeongjuensis TaxID=354355 RepID=A0A1V9F8F2_9BACT|nr:FecR family protein [Niastella yeongjuensis]OQP54551.1 hypothetical protein A4H97_21520 [Niastella yeongjuensis]SEN98734.1 FecR family protein [Niastella yeongjuensis]
MNDLELYELLKRKESNELNEAEEQLLDEWFNTLEHKPAEADRIVAMKNRVWLMISNRLSLSVSHMPWVKYLAAASVLLAVLCTALYLTHTYKKSATHGSEQVAIHSIKVPSNEQMRLALGDGTVIWLNGGAELDYPTAFGKIRNVYLKQGEAFFEVARDTTRPFLVHSGQLYTKVLGTSFDIRQRNGQYTVAVASGKVKVYYGDKDRESAVSPVLSAGERLMTDNGGNHPVVDKLDKTLYKGWTDKVYQLKNVSLEGIAFCMESIYGITVRIQSAALKNLTFTTSFSNKDNLNEVLTRLSLAGDFHYKIVDTRTVLIY